MLGNNAAETETLLMLQTAYKEDTVGKLTSTDSFLLSLFLQNFFRAFCLFKLDITKTKNKQTYFLQKIVWPKGWVNEHWMSCVTHTYWQEWLIHNPCPKIFIPIEVNIVYSKTIPNINIESSIK